MEMSSYIGPNPTTCPFSPSLFLSFSESTVMTTPGVELWTILSESKHILNVHSPHPHFLPLSYTLFLCLFTLCSLATITCTLFHAFYATPLHLNSFLPLSLLKALFLSQLIVFSTSLLFSLLSSLLLRAISLLAIPLPSSSSPSILAFSAVLLLSLLFALVCFQVNCTLASVVAAADSSWGLVPPRRSASFFIRGMKAVAFLSSLFFFVVLTVGSSAGGGGVWKEWGFVVQVVVTWSFMVLLLLYNAVGNTVLYVYFKSVHGEIAEEFARGVC